MSNIKKKLPTGPIRIDIPVSGTREPLPEENTIQETAKPDSYLPETSKIDPTKEDFYLPETSKIDPTKEGSFFKEKSSHEEVFKGRRNPAPAVESKEDMDEPEEKRRLLESSFLFSSLEELEYKKVAMRLSTLGADRLRRLRIDTGIPYEILVDVMIRNWDTLPGRIKTAYLKQAKMERNTRLIAGQEKTMKTMRKKYLED